MEPTELMLAAVAALGGCVSFAFGFILNGFRSRLDTLGDAMTDHGDRISHIEGARDAERP